MRKKFKKLLSLMMALALLAGVFAPGVALADMKEDPPTLPAGTIASSDLSATKPDNTQLIITKLQSNNYSITDTIAHNGGSLDQDQLKALLGDGVSVLPGVTFTYFKVEDPVKFAEMVDNPGVYKTVDAVRTKLGLEEGDPQYNGTALDPTGENGQATVDLPEGYYWFIETGRPANVTGQMGVPFGIGLPQLVKTGEGDQAKTQYLSKVYVYPKNETSEKPGPKKTVDDMENVHGTHDVGDTFPWFLQATIPASIGNYTVLNLTDSFSPSLTYVGNVVVKFVPEGNTFDNTPHEAFVLNTDYEVSQPEENAKGKGDPENPDLTITMKAAGLTKLTGLRENEAGSLVARVETKINEDAIIGLPIPNQYTLEFGNKSGTETKDSDEPDVTPGGKKFVKVDADDTDMKLPGAVFEIHRVKGQKIDDWKNLGETKPEKVTWTTEMIAANQAAITAGKFVADETGAAFGEGKPAAGDVIYLMSDANGEFEIKGLELSEIIVKGEGEGATRKYNSYALKEVKAPGGYALSQEYQPFTIETNSYYAQPDQVNLGTQEGDGAEIQIKNIKLTIPQTGGIGSMVFILGGLALMGGAGIAMKRTSKEEEEE